MYNPIKYLILVDYLVGDMMMEFLVLGQVPGTDVVLNFWLWILIVGSVIISSVTLVSKRLTQAMVGELRTKKQRRHFETVTL